MEDIMDNFKRLYDAFKPERYEIFLDISREKKTIKGKVTVHGEALQPNFRLNQKFLKPESVKVAGSPCPFSCDDNAEVMEIKAGRTGKMQIEIEYSAALTNPMMGIYPSYYQIDGVKKQLIGTQFETTFARQAFPCVDEPAAKATFDLAIKFDELPGERVFANQPEIKCVDGVHYFERTVKMSTYLLAFVCGELQEKFTHTASGVKVGVLATKAHQPKELDFALDIAVRSIEFYENFYQTPYPLAQSYQVGLPDFSAGAMENWGLVTYRESCLLLDPDNHSLPTKQRVATVIAHELAHQWFGDLVTMRWWDDLWLNESFANMMEYVACDALEPNLKIWEVFNTNDVPAALRRDATDGVQSVYTMVNDPAEIDALFDSAIVYAKGARMLVMVRALIGNEALRQGLKAYFAKHKYGNAAGRDLWAALEAASGLKIGEIMATWLEQPGYPVVSASIENGDLVLRQKQFFIGEHQDRNRLWQIPLNSNYAAAPTLMKSAELNLGNYAALRAEAGKAFRLNVGNNSHFIVNYSDELLADILPELAEADSIEQLQLLQDQSLLAQAGVISYAAVIPLLKQLRKAGGQIVHRKIVGLLNTLQDFVIPGSEDEVALKHFVNTLSADQLNGLTALASPDDDNDRQQKRPLIYNEAIYAENPDAKAELHEIFAQTADPANLPAAMRWLIMKNEIKNYGSPALFEQLLEAYRTAVNAAYKDDLCSALCSSSDPVCLKRLLASFKDSDIIKPQDLRSWYMHLLDNPASYAATWDWIKREWDWLEREIGGDMSFTYYISLTAAIFHTAEQLAEFKAFFLPKVNTPGLGREINMGIKVISSKADLIAATRSSVLAAIRNN